MKKLAIAALCALSGMAFANSEQKAESTQPQSTAQPAAQTQVQEARPVVVLAVYDVTDSKNVKRLEKREVSRSNPNHRLCWTAANVEPINVNLTIEQFTTPTTINFVDEQGVRAQHDKSGKVHLFTGRAATLNGGLVEKCWKFDKKYPVGEYSLALRVNDIEFSAITFKIVK